MSKFKIEAIRQKLNHLRETVNFNKNLEVFNDSDGNGSIFNRISHRYHLGPCLSETEIANFQKRFAITLPEDYCAFLLEIGNGGGGNGLYTLEKGIEIAERKVFHGKSNNSSKDPSDILHGLGYIIAQPFPLVAPHIRPEYLGQAAMDKFIESLELPIYVQGTLPVADFGCAIDILLVVTGTMRGTLWLDDRHSDNGVWPVRLIDGKVDFNMGFEARSEERNNQFRSWQSCDFITWYESWLDEQIDTLEDYKRGK